MPVDFEGRFKRLLKEIVTISNGIRNLALDHANSQNFDVSEKFRRQLETIRASADAILEAFARATLTSHGLDDRITDWLADGEPRSCLNKLKELEDMLKPVEQAPSPAQPRTEDKVTAAMDFLDKNNALFRFLLTPDIWKCELPEASQANRLSITRAYEETQAAQSSASVTVYEPPLLSDTNQIMAAGPKREFIKQKLDEVSRWLAPLECTQKHHDTLRLRQEGTCKWFPNTDVYEKWRAPGSRFLWLNGKGGCGKSVLIASTIEHLKTTLSEGEVVVFFYCDFQNERSTSPAELMRSLLCQLLYHIGDQGVDPGDFPDKILKQKSEGTLLLDDHRKLCDLVSRAASFFGYEPLIVIDALDECVDIETLLPAIVTLSKSDVRLLVTSRPNQAIVDRFAGLQSLSFEDVIEEIAADIALHVRRELDSHYRLRSATPETKEGMFAKLTERAEGRFRWVHCQLDTLKRCATRETLREALDDLPNELEATYERILGAVDERKLEGQLVRRVLALLMVALEPLRLAQIVDGLSMDVQKRQNVHKVRQWLQTTLVHALSSLVSYSEETDVLMLSHFTVKEYLTSSSALPTYQVISHEAHDQTIQLCMGYLSVVLQSKLFHGNLASLRSFPMLSYVLSSGFNHLANANSGSTVTLDALQLLASVARSHPSQWDRLCELREETIRTVYPPWPSSRHDIVLYILIAYCSPGFLQKFLYSNHPLKPRAGTNPLVYAADLRRTGHAMALLACGVDINMCGPVVDDSRRASPLEVAIDLGDDVLVAELLRRGCLVTPQLLATAVCMPWCSTRVLVNLMQTDEFAEWALGIGDEDLYRSIFNSARPDAGDSKKTDEDHVNLARRLRQLGQDVSADSRFGKELVVRALHAAHMSMLEFLLPPDEPPPGEFLIAVSTGDTSETVSMVRFLLRKGVDVRSVSDDSGDTALHLAAMCPWEPRGLELASLLLDAGCNPHELNHDDETPLVIAVRHGHGSAVQLLLSHNVPLPSGILHVALANHHLDIRTIQLLILEGACDVASFNALHEVLDQCPVCEDWVGDRDQGQMIACEERNESKCFYLIKLFIDVGCHRASCNSDLRATALKNAVRRGFTSVVELLLQSSAARLPPDILSFALHNDCTLPMIQLLVHKGADVHFVARNGDNLLHITIELETEPRCLELLEIFIAAGCDPATPNSNGTTILELAVRVEDISVLELLLQSSVSLPPDILLSALQNYCTPQMIQFLAHKGADVHFITPDGDSLLHVTIDQVETEPRRLELLEAFMTAGCNPATRNSDGETILEIAVAEDDIPVLELLLRFNVPLPPDILLFALRDGCALEMIEFLVLKGANGHFTTSDGEGLLRFAISKESADEPLYSSLINNIIATGCNSDAFDFGGKTIVEVAVQHGYYSVLECLPPWLGDFFSPDILLFALRNQCAPRMIQLLVLKGANVCFTTPDGINALHLAIDKYAEETCYQLLQVLIDAGCNYTVHHPGHKTALDVAIERGYNSVVKRLLQFDESFPPGILIFALRHQWTPQMIHFLLRKGANVHFTTPNGDTALHFAIAGYADETCCHLVKKLTDAGCNPAASNDDGKTVLETAMEHAYISVVEVLLYLNVPFPPDILLFAVRQRSTIETVKFLIDKGANVHAMSSDGDTLLHLAIAGYAEGACRWLVQSFIDAGCDPTICDPGRKTVLEAAVERGYTLVVELLLQYNAPLSPGILCTALWHRSTSWMVQLLTRNGGLAGSGPINWHSLLEPLHAMYSGQCRQLIIEILNTSHQAYLRARSGFGDETCMHVAKRPRLE